MERERSRATALLERPTRPSVDRATGERRDSWWQRLLTSPVAISRVVLAIGVLTVLSAASPEIHSRVALVTHVLPGAFPAAAATGSLAVGTFMILLSRAVRRGKFRAWLVATVLAGTSAVLHLVKGLDVEEAASSFLLLLLLLRSRAGFTARPDPRSNLRVAVVALLGPVIATGLGTIWLALDVDGQAAGTTWLDRVGAAFTGLVGVQGPISYTSNHIQITASVGLAVLGAAVFLAFIAALTQPAGGPHRLSEEEDAEVRRLIGRWGEQDSLAYFATRADRSLLMSPNHQAGVTYRVVGTVSLAGGDPIGNPDAWPEAIEGWLRECVAYGWTPAVLGASEPGAVAYRRAGLDALELGDEAVIETASFCLEGREMRGVRQAVARCERAGLTVRCLRVGELEDHEREHVTRLADEWRDGETERGFSMALGRFVSDADPDSVLVLAQDGDGRLHGLLSLVPWGRAGLSLDLMRRDRDSANGLIELMVSQLCAAAPTLGVERISLNFAVFRAVFERGDRVGAGPVLRLWCGVLRLLSRYWQLESLYRSNKKYRPDWVPRFLCFRHASDLPRIGAAALRAEAFLVLPSWLTRRP